MSAESAGNGGKKERVAVIGAGKVGTAVAEILASHGYPVTRVYDEDETAARRAAAITGASPATSGAEAAAEADLVLVTTPDARIAAACADVADAGLPLEGKIFVHMSGALSVRSLDAAAALGARVLCAHPMQTFADLEGVLRALPGSTFGVTCEPDMREWASGFVADLGGAATFIADEDKALYHAAAVVACNLLVMLEFGAQELYTGLGLTREESLAAFMPLANETIRNVGRLGPAAALTGPLARGDTSTIAAHLEALEAAETELALLYRGVSLWGLRLVAERGELPPERIEEMRALLQGG